MKKKLFENVGKNCFKLSENQYYDDYENERVVGAFNKNPGLWDQDEPSGPPRTPEERAANDEYWNSKKKEWFKIDKKIKAIQKFLDDKRAKELYALYTDKASDNLKKDPDVKYFIDDLEYRLKDTGHRSSIPNDKIAYKAYVSGMLKILALKNRSLAQKMFDFFKGIFKE